MQNLLDLFEEGKLLDRGVGLRGGYRKLAHPTLAQQLKPYISETSKNIRAREVALDIFEACELEELQNNVSSVALDSLQPLTIRKRAACAISAIGTEEARKSLRALVIDGTEKDLDDELKGCVLSALWPEHIAADELFEVLTYPKRRNYIGEYHMFFTHNLVEHLRPIDTPVALSETDIDN